jgi:hypothetical protein
MWFFNNVRPSVIDAKFIVTSLPSGYQSVQVWFSANVDSLVGFAVPSAPNKVNGGIVISDAVEAGCELPECTIYTNPRAIKSVQGTEPFNVSEYLQCYLEDFALVTFNIKANCRYMLQYKHKMCYDSKIFVNSRLPTLVWTQPNAKIDITVVANNVKSYGMSKNLTHVSGNTYKVSNFEEDATFSTDNWESSDDE